MNNDKIKVAYAIIHELNKNIDKEKVKRLFISLEGNDSPLLKFQQERNITINDINDILNICNEKELKNLNIDIDDNFRKNKNSHKIIATEMLTKIRDSRKYEKNSIIY